MLITAMFELLVLIFLESFVFCFKIDHSLDDCIFFVPNFILQRALEAWEWLICICLHFEFGWSVHFTRVVVRKSILLLFNVTSYTTQNKNFQFNNLKTYGKAIKFTSPFTVLRKTTYYVKFSSTLNDMRRRKTLLLCFCFF